MTPTDWVEVFKAGVWPLTVIVLVFSFRTLLRHMVMNRLRSAKVAGAEFEFADLADAGVVAGVKTEKALETTDWSRTGALFWFANDISGAISALYAARSRRIVLNFVDRTINHTKQLKLDKAILDSLLHIKETIVVSPPDWSLEDREYLITELSRVFNSVGDLAKAHENQTSATPFKADPDNAL